MKHLAHMFGLLIVAFGLIALPLPSLAAHAAMPCCDGMEMAADGSHQMAMPGMDHHACADMKGGSEQPDCCKPVAHAPAVALPEMDIAAPPALFVAFFLTPVAVPESAPSGLRTPPPNA